MIRTLLITLSCVAIVAAAGRYLQLIESDYSNQLQNTPEQQYYTHQFKNFSLTNTNALGDAQSVIYSPATQLLVAEQKTLMDSPKITMYRDQQAPIIMTADFAEVLHEQNVTILNKNVHVSMPNLQNKSIVMTTEQLTLNNASQSAKTDLPANIVHGKGSMQGVGLEFNPHTQQIKFLNKVRGIYEY
jgi:LPS export ABC transporter protein LptC